MRWRHEHKRMHFTLGDALAEPVGPQSLGRAIPPGAGWLPGQAPESHIWRCSRSLTSFKLVASWTPVSFADQILDQLCRIVPHTWANPIRHFLRQIRRKAL